MSPSRVHHSLTRRKVVAQLEVLSSSPAQSQRCTLRRNRHSFFAHCRRFCRHKLGASWQWQATFAFLLPSRTKHDVAPHSATSSHADNECESWWNRDVICETPFVCVEGTCLALCPADFRYFTNTYAPTRDNLPSCSSLVRPLYRTWGPRSAFRTLPLLNLMWMPFFATDHSFGACWPAAWALCRLRGSTAPEAPETRNAQAIPPPPPPPPANAGGVRTPPGNPGGP